MNVLSFKVLDLEFVSNFEFRILNLFRISCFEFRASTQGVVYVR